MLNSNDLDLFLEAFELAGLPGGDGAAWPPAGLLEPSGKSLHSSDVLRLSRVLVIAELLQDAPENAALAADRVARQIGDRRCTSFDNKEVWAAAIAWALAQPDPPGPSTKTRDLVQARQRFVAEATRRLRKKRFAVQLDGHGPQMSETTRENIAWSVESSVARIGGIEVIGQILRILRDTNRQHDGLWLFGDEVPGTYQSKQPSLPWGWLISLGLRHVGTQQTAKKPDVVWRSMIELAVDFTTVLDCERYNQFDGMFVSPGDFLLSAVEGLTWREVFTLPQVPPIVLDGLRYSFGEVLTEDDERALGVSLNLIFAEIEVLLRTCNDDTPTIISADVAESRLPNLILLATGKRGAVNQKYRDPLKASNRNQDDLILFEMNTGEYLALTRSLVTAAACESIFRIIWSTLKRRAAKVVGDVIEKAIEWGCAGKTDVKIAKSKYRDGKNEYEIDVACRDRDQIVLIEAKAKVLTRQTRSLDPFSYLNDYSNSYLSLLKQLARHEHFLKTDPGICTALGPRSPLDRTLKIAVSPLSFGPVSDKAFSNQAYCSMINVDLMAEGAGDAEMAAIRHFNNINRESLEWVLKVAKCDDGKFNVFGYLMDLFWLDLGQFLYAASRADGIVKAVAPLQYMTFSSRDFWTEVAFADRQGLTAQNWKPVTTKR